MEGQFSPIINRTSIRRKLLLDISKHRKGESVSSAIVENPGALAGYVSCVDAPMYCVNMKGEVRNSITGKKMRESLDRDGYCKITLKTESGQKPFRAHRLVAKAFLPNPENKPSVNHKDGIKHNNSVRNLEWVTAKENYEHARNVLKVGMYQVTVDTMLINKIQILVDALEGIGKINKNEAIRARIYRALKKIKEE